MSHDTFVHIMMACIILKGILSIAMYFCIYKSFTLGIKSGMKS